MSAKTILLVEDNASDIGLTQRALRKARISNDLVVVSDGEEALDYLFGTGSHAQRDASELPAMALLDLKLPKVMGLEVLRRIRMEACTRRLPVVILTSSQQVNDTGVAYDLGANSYIRKPIDFNKFAEVVGKLGQYWLETNVPPPKVT